ncbi:hypothetical protein [Luteimonas terricola]|uniref:Uncharacterized protein n=1 Tax=Luteimonas terricola TaxID=645597 RepID=A0ABQ2EFL6_9GAMM|nr:hypothetical protein [Luteimonas terricola]GGK10781.1 hypothetical protein GCM10011394_20330 [Luteimonas terricola]
MRWPGFREDGSLALPLDPAPLLPPAMPLRLRLDGHVLERKRELHMTLLGRDAGAALRIQLGDERIRALFESVEWAPRGTGRYALLHKAKDQWDGTLQAWSLIEHLQAPACAEFRYHLAQASGLALDCGVPHATLYVVGDPYGIGLPDLAAYRACFVREVAASEVIRDPITAGEASR